MNSGLSPSVELWNLYTQLTPANSSRNKNRPWNVFVPVRDGWTGVNRPAAKLSPSGCVSRPFSQAVKYAACLTAVPNWGTMRVT
jgi:hypothetical protein